MKIEILDGWVDLDVKCCREVNGIIVINDTEYTWYLYTDDGFTSTRVIVDGEDVNLEDEDECEQLGLTEDEGIEIFDEILNLVSEDYSIEGWDE
jgi:hypothetical protein